MTKDESKQFLPIIQAWADGKPIQYRVVRDGPWFDATRLEFSYPPEHYRIKPEPPKPREWFLMPKTDGGWMVFPNASQIVTGIRVREVLEKEAQ